MARLVGDARVVQRVLAVVCGGFTIRGMRRFGIFLIVLLAVAGGGAWHFRDRLAGLWRAGPPAMVPAEVKPVPDPESYAVLVGDLKRWRGELAASYAATRDPEKRAEIERDARVLLELALPEMMRCWLGTPWDFHGTAAVPGGGKIACGYFVSTVLMDAGFKVDRYRLAKQPSENILRTFLSREDCELTVGLPYEEFADEAARLSPGVYVVGLDTHVAFLVVPEGGAFRFIHSSGSKPWCVVDESRENAEVLRKSKWRMLGNLTADAGVVRQWLSGKVIPVRGA